MELPLTNRSVPSLERLTDEMETPALDDRKYRVVRLPNQLEALIIHDADTDKASAALDVNVGSFSDADDMPGMAHAVEHLLFMGTEKVRLLHQSADRKADTDYSILKRTHTINILLLTADPQTPTQRQLPLTTTLKWQHQTHQPVVKRHLV
jgi:hypothetical protein